MNDIEKLCVLLPHWIEHNKNHEKEFNKWLDIINNAGEDRVSTLLNKAVTSLQEIDSVLTQIADIIGPLPDKHSHDHDHTHHH